MNKLLGFEVLFSFWESKSLIFKEMTTSSLSRDFRKINIEQYEDDFYEDEIEDNGNQGPDASQVQNLISGGKVTVSEPHLFIKYIYSRWIQTVELRGRVNQLAQEFFLPRFEFTLIDKI